MPVQTRMIDVGDKAPTERRAIASGKIWMNAEALTAIRHGKNPKGDVLTLAQGAGVMGAKRTADLLPLCHPIMLDGITVECDLRADHVSVRCQVKTTGKTGVEMEALCGAHAALLCIYDMSKIIDPNMRIGDLLVDLKEGGKTGRHAHGTVSSQQQERLGGMRVGIVVASDRCARGEAEDKSGPLLQSLCEKDGATVVSRCVVTDDERQIAGACRHLADEGTDVVLLSGGTGLGPRDRTPEALRSFISYEVPGIGELLRGNGATHTPMAWLSRSMAGVLGQTLFIALPGSSKAVAEGYEALIGLLQHARHILQGGGHA